MKHTATLSTGSLQIKKGGLEITVDADDKRFGTLVISNGTIAWYPKGIKAKRNAYFLSWERFQEVMSSTKTAKK